METGGMVHDNRSALPPFPEGWYFVASRESILKEKLIEKTWLGENIVAWCDDDGLICVAEAVCPHMGADLRPGGGGTVRKGCLVCPFHGFEFDATGQCVATPFAPPPRTARLKVFETQEVLGLVFAWWGIGGRQPQWSLPRDPPNGADWSRMAFCTFRFKGHPQETTENSVDFAHLGFVHGYDNVRPVGAVSVDGAYLKSCFDFRRSQCIAGLVDILFDVTAVTHVHGLGYSFVDIHEHSIGMAGRLWVLATPVDGTQVEVVLVSQIKDIARPKRFVVGLGFVPARLRGPLMNRIMIATQKHDVAQDVVIWERKQYRSRPHLSRADGGIAVYRRYCNQFYPDADATLAREGRYLRSV